MDGWREWLVGWTTALAQAGNDETVRRRMIRQLAEVGPALTPAQLAELRREFRLWSMPWSDVAWSEVDDAIHQLERAAVDDDRRPPRRSSEADD